MTQYIRRGKLSVATELDQFIEQQAIANTGVDFAHFWTEFENILEDFVPRNQALLEKRDQLQAQIDGFHVGQPEADFAQYKAFLQDIGYLVDAPSESRVETANVDAEIATLAGPQLVVPINNARYALNAVNARWGSLYDALYGTDVISEADGAEKTNGYNATRGQKVAKLRRVKYLDTIAPLETGSHTDATAYTLLKDNLQLH